MSSGTPSPSVSGVGVGVAVGVAVGVGVGSGGGGVGGGVAVGTGVRLGAGVTVGGPIGVAVGAGGASQSVGCGPPTGGTSVSSGAVLAPSPGGSVGSDDGEGPSDEVGDGSSVRSGLTVAEGAPASTPSAGVGRPDWPLVDRPSPSQLDPIATIAATSRSEPPVARTGASRAILPGSPRNISARTGGAVAAPTSMPPSVSIADAERRQRSQPAAWRARSRGGSSPAPSERSDSQAANRSCSSPSRITSAPALRWLGCAPPWAPRRPLRRRWPRPRTPCNGLSPGGSGRRAGGHRRP